MRSRSKTPSWVLQYDPPTVGLKYAKGGKSVLRSIQVPRDVLLDAATDCTALASTLLPHFCPPLKEGSSREQLERVVERLMDAVSGERAAASPSARGESTPPARARDARNGATLRESLDKVLDADEAHNAELLKADLTKLGDEEVQRAKEIMDVEFEKNRVTKGDAAFEYDKRVEFAQPTEASPWDDDSDED